MLSTSDRIRPASRFGFWLTAVAGVAFAVRLLRLLTSSGGLGGDYGYDPGVYYASSVSLLHGDLPYADYILLHPPGMTLVLTPFAAIGALTTDHLGFEVATVSFVALGAVNAALVGAVARRCGLDRRAALLGAAFYAVWFGAVQAEVSTRLEPLGTACVLVAALLLVRPDATGRATAWAGAAMGLAVCVKIWWVVPPAVVLIVLLRTRRHRVLPFAAGAFAAGAVVCLPFFLAAPGAMWRMVVVDQLARQHSGRSVLDRLDALTSLGAVHVPASGFGLVVLVAVVAAVAVLTARAWTNPAGRVVAVLVWVQAAVLLASPAFFGFYSGYLAAAVALLVAFGTRPGRGPALPVAAVTGAALVTAHALVFGAGHVSSPFPGPALADRVTSVRCLMTDSPMALIALDALSRNIVHDCPNRVDVTGRTFDATGLHSGRYRSRAADPYWQDDMLRYLRSGNAVVLIRPATGLSAATLREIRSWPVLARAGGVVVYRTPG